MNSYLLVFLGLVLLIFCIVDLWHLRAMLQVLRNVEDLLTPKYVVNHTTPKYRLLGYKGSFGVDFYDKKRNKKYKKANLLIDLYNSKINTFKTEKTNNKFAEQIQKDIDKILK